MRKAFGPALAALFAIPFFAWADEGGAALRATALAHGAAAQLTANADLLLLAESGEPSEEPEADPAAHAATDEDSFYEPFIPAADSTTAAVAPEPVSTIVIGEGTAESGEPLDSAVQLEQLIAAARARDSIAQPEELALSDNTDEVDTSAAAAETGSTAAGNLIEAEAGQAGSNCGCGHCKPCGECRDCESRCGCKSCGTLEFFGPMAVINQHPPALLTLQPEPDVATVLPEGESFLRNKVDISNVFIRELDSGVIVDYDYEELRNTIDYTLGLAGGELSVELPISSRSSGVLDDLIDSWHQWFGLLGGMRARFPTEGYRFVIETREGPVFNGAETTGIGDLAVFYKLPINDNGQGDALALRGGVKFPTGDPDKALGSGNFDYSVGALWQTQITPHLRGYVNADYIFVGEPDWQNVGWQDSLITDWAIEYSLKRNTTVSALYRTHKNPLRLGSNQADKDSQTFGLGLNHRVNDNLVLTGGFDEDINPETAPDFIAVFHLKWEF